MNFWFYYMWFKCNKLLKGYRFDAEQKSRMKRTGEINESLLTEKKADQKLPYGSLRENLQEEPKLYLDDEPKANNYVVFDPEQECTSTQIISHIGFGKSQVVMMTVLFFAWFAEHSEINLMPILSTRLYVEMDLTPELESALGAASFAGFAVSYPLWGIIADKIGRRPTLILSHCWILFWGILCCLAPSLTWLIVFRVMYSLAGGKRLFHLFSRFLEKSILEKDKHLAVYAINKPRSIYCNGISQKKQITQMIWFKIFIKRLNVDHHKILKLVNENENIKMIFYKIQSKLSRPKK